MKKGILSLILAGSMAFVACSDATSKIENDNSADQEAVVEGTPSFAFNEESWDFGDINEGKLAEHTFSFTNTGDAPLVIYNAKGSCGCTVPKWSKEPIAPGATGEIKVSFNSSGRPGVNNKNVTITANTVPNKKILKITTNVLPKPKEEAAE